MVMSREWQTGHKTGGHVEGPRKDKGSDLR